MATIDEDFNALSSENERLRTVLENWYRQGDVSGLRDLADELFGEEE